MAFKSVVTLEKPMEHLSLSDWHNRVNQLRNIADTRRTDAFNLRQEARTLRNETRIASDWVAYETNETLSERISELGRWRSTIEQSFERIKLEMQRLAEEKALTERELRTMQFPITVLSECLTMRDCRLGDELTYDDADTEIKRELAIIENNQQLLADQCQKAWEKLCRLEEVKFKIGLEIGNKAEAEELDAQQLGLDKVAACISFKPDATRVPHNAVSYAKWLEHTRNIKQMAENELADTYTIRESLFICREKAVNMLKCQQERAEHSIRKRIFQTQRARNELQWQQTKMQDEMQKAVCEIKYLEQALRDKTDNLKLAETRLENRAQRSGGELCLDEAHLQLSREVETLRTINRTLKRQLDDAKVTFYQLEAHAKNIDVDLQNKEHSLVTDNRAMAIRERLKGGEFGLTDEQPSPTIQTERNIGLVKMQDMIPKE